MKDFKFKLAKSVISIALAAGLVGSIAFAGSPAKIPDNLRGIETGAAKLAPTVNPAAGVDPFTVEPGAPVDSLYVSGIGNIGLGKATPLLKLTIFRNDTPAIRFDQDSSGGYIAQIWDIGANEANFFVRDATNGVTLPFRIRPGAPTSSLDISASGNVGIGIATPTASLDVRRADGTAQVMVREESGTPETRNLLTLSNRGPIQFKAMDIGSGTTWTTTYQQEEMVVSVTGTTGSVVSVDQRGNMTIAGTLTESSDRRLKENFESVSGREVLDRLDKVPITKWNFKRDGKAVRHIGPMAQDFHAAFGLSKDDKHIAPLDVNGVTLAAVKELNQELRKRDVEVKSLKKRNASLEARLAKLEKMMGAAQGK